MQEKSTCQIPGSHFLFILEFCPESHWSHDQLMQESVGLIQEVLLVPSQ